jgi:hypothetical protein
LERVEAGLAMGLEEVLTVCGRGRSEELREHLRGMTVKEGMALTGYSRRQVHYLRSGQPTLSPERLDALLPLIPSFGGR